MNKKALVEEQRNMVPPGNQSRNFWGRSPLFDWRDILASEQTQWWKHAWLRIIQKIHPISLQEQHVNMFLSAEKCMGNIFDFFFFFCNRAYNFLAFYFWELIKAFLSL